jgi:type I restriction enzyme S subunit
LIEVLAARFAARVSTLTRADLAGSPFASLLPGWNRMRLRRLFSSSAYGTGEAARESGRIAVLGMSNVRDGEVVGEPSGYVDYVGPELRLRAGDLLFNRTNSLALVGKVALVRSATEPTTIASYVVLFRTNELADATYLSFFLNAPEFLGLARSLALPSIGQANLNPARYGSIVVAVPPPNDQVLIGRELDTARDELKRSLDMLRVTIRLLLERRQAIVTAAISGQIDIPGAA